MRSTNPSFQSRAKLDLKGCDRFAAGVGYVFEQESVLVSRYGVGDVGYGNVRFPTGALTGASAQAFFLHAATTNDGLGGGYSGVDDDMVFINLRSPTGAPYSQLDDTAYLTALKGAAASYKTVTVTFAEEGKSDAHLVANSWSGKKEGEDYLTAFTAEPSVVSTLKSLRMRFETEAKAAAAALP